MRKANFDMATFGYTNFSEPRVGNLLRRSIIYNGNSSSYLYQLLAFESPNDRQHMLFRNLETGELDELPLSNLTPTLFDPENSGFKVVGQRMDHLLTNGVVDLKEVSNGDTKLGFEVRHATTGDYLLRVKSVRLPFAEKFTEVGLEYIHELQNLYSDLFPDKTLDLTSFIQSRIQGQKKNRANIDRYEVERLLGKK
ncbi:hypothetical protein [Dyadobacter sp. CY326]|uniref:hypothetical protein n=1 Tax=Dyadobacter sp. CY326 TaxID=2907300 RepID=UPI001F286C1C|nr:hypothetical protein [Dyadobacter sp. CY326]MCE7064020.1 hypothetical protein [Dyadobacter sp. CY326]